MILFIVNIPILLSITIGTLFLGALSVPSADAAVDMFLKIEGIEGESQAKGHENDIDVLAWSWGMSQSGSFHVGGGGGAGKANFQDLSVTKFVDRASVALMLHCANGNHFEEATLTVRKAGDKDPIEFLVITMDRILVSSYSTGGSGGEDRLTENVSLNFAKFGVKYTEDSPDPGSKATTEFKWDIAANDEL